MSTYRVRPSSPPRQRESHRTSAGNLYVMSYDTLSSGHSGRSTANSVNSRTSNGPYEVKPVRQTVHADGRRTEYVVRPRHNSTTGQENRRPLSIATTRPLSPRRGLLIAASPREVSSAGIRDESSRYLQPASSLAHRQQASHHQRHNSTSRAELEQYNPYRDRKDQTYHVHAPEAPKQQMYVTRSRPSRKSEDETWSYTGPREQFDRDYPQRPQRDNHSRRERPTNAYESDRDLPSPRRDHHGPPPSASRQLARIERSENDRRPSRSGFDSDSDRPNDGSHKRQSSKPLAILHQNRDEGYSSARDDYESRGHSRLTTDRYTGGDDDRKGHRSHRDSHRDLDKGHRHAYDYDDQDRDHRRDYDRGDRTEHRRKPRSRDSSPQRPHYKDMATGALGGLAAGGTLGKLLGRDSKDKGADSGDEQEKHHRRRRRSRKEDGNSDDSDEHRRSHKRDDSSGDTIEGDHRRKHRSRRSHHYDDEENGDRSSDSQRPARPRSSSRAYANDDKRDRYSRETASSPLEDEDPYATSHRTISPGENEDDRPRKVMLVEPEKTEAVKPRGILKAPRAEPFPEDPNPIREGVAPLKDATKDGVPPSARWTKINRVLVNPEALEKANERFEEREDYVIVLRVLSREEIQKLAALTVQIRQTRVRGWQREIDNGHKSSNGHHDDRDEDDQDERPRLAIEAAPAGPTSNDLRNLTQPAQEQQYPPQSLQQPQQQRQPSPQPQSLPLRAQSGNPYPTDTTVGQNYSQNV